jgi:hypothetical protein
MSCDSGGVLDIATRRSWRGWAAAPRTVGARRYCHPRMAPYESVAGVRPIDRNPRPQELRDRDEREGTMKTIQEHGDCLESREAIMHELITGAEGTVVEKVSEVRSPADSPRL